MVNVPIFHVYKPISSEERAGVGSIKEEAAGRALALVRISDADAQESRPLATKIVF